MSLIIGLISNILALYLAQLWVAGFGVIGGWKAYLIAGVALSLLNWVVKPIIKIITGPLILLSLGLFLIVINAIIVWLAARLTGYIVVDGYVPLLLATIIIAAVNLIAKPFK
ncbi:MAG: phage holin family protein [Candidatus Yanofskybacteria bacterium]|nr:phage holin family protein [Candidatus Yanofskybacteria bacterium]